MGDLGRRVYGVGVIALGMIGLVLRDFVLGQPVPKDFPARTVLALAVGVFLVVAGAALWSRRTAAWSGAALAVYYAVVVVGLMNGRLLLKHYAEYGTYSGMAEQLSIGVGGLIVYASRAGNRRLMRLGQIAFGVCALLFGGAHFVYMNLTAPLVPHWLPPGQVFWGYATGIAFVAAGVALLTGVRARLAAGLLTAMLAGFAVMVHLPMLLADPKSRMNWTENSINLAVMGVAWVVAEASRE